MRQKYTPVIQAKKQQGQTNGRTAEELGPTLKQVKELFSRQNCKERLGRAGYVSLPKDRPRKTSETEADLQRNEIVKLQMQVE